MSRVLIKCASNELIEAMRGIAPFNQHDYSFSRSLSTIEIVQWCRRDDSDEIMVACSWMLTTHLPRHLDDDDIEESYSTVDADFKVNCRACWQALVDSIDPVRRDYLLEQGILVEPKEFT